MSAHLFPVHDAAPFAHPPEPEWVTRKGLLYIRARNEKGAWTLELDGELDASTAQLLEQQLRLAEGAAAHSITVDLRGLDFMDSTGVRVLLEAQDRIGPGGRLRILPGPRAVHKVFRLTGTEGALPFDGVPDTGPTAA
jgi:anti-sigma B factor antagonist